MHVSRGIDITDPTALKQVTFHDIEEAVLLLKKLA
jgi:hypothetical protein